MKKDLVQIKLPGTTTAFVNKVAKLAGLKPETVIVVILAAGIVQGEQK